MARPKKGYFNSAGQPIPGTGDINGRYMDRSRLMYWAHSRGKAGLKLYDNSALDIGTCVHMMAELDMKGRAASDIEFYLTTTLPDPGERKMAESAFAAFREWRKEFHVRAYKQEISLVSEQLQFGGTLDTIAHIRGGLGMIDFKTTSKGEVYEDHVLQLAAYGILWNENHPAEKLTAGYHLILLPKEGGAPIHREYTHDQLNPFRQTFWLYRQAYNFAPVCNDPKVLAGSKVAPSYAPPAKPRVRIEPRSAPMSMGELLRSYGHVKEGIPA